MNTKNKLMDAIQRRLEDYGTQDILRLKRVGFITFGEEVTIWGDGSTPPVVIRGDALDNELELENIIQRIPILDSVTKSMAKLKETFQK